ncbi:MAG: hypothetical protein L0H70_03245 [Xanthomonadales bacterium]|nr:hypothetical protein [Xanthomonadales bacterium]
MRRISLLLAIIVLGGCATQKIQNALQPTLDGYAAALRWNGFEPALQYVDPATLKAHPLTDLQRARYAQVRVSSYDVQGSRAISDTRVEQMVEIGLINKNTQAARRITDKEQWRYDAKAQRWWLESGLPEIVAD